MSNEGEEKQSSHGGKGQDPHDLERRLRFVLEDEETAGDTIEEFFHFMRRASNLRAFTSVPALEAGETPADGGINICTSHGDFTGLLYALGSLVKLCAQVNEDKYSVGIVPDLLGDLLQCTIKAIGWKKHVLYSSDVSGLKMLYEGISSLICRKQQLNFQVIRMATEILFVRTRLDLYLMEGGSKLGMVYDTFFGSLYANLESVDRKGILQIIKSSIIRYGLLTAFWEGCTLLSPVVKVIGCCDSQEEMDLIESILTSLASHNITIIDLKNILFAMRLRIKKGSNWVPRESYLIVNVLQNPECIVSETDSQVLFTSMTKPDKTHTALPQYFDMLLNVLSDASIRLKARAAYSFYMSGLSSGLAMHLLPNNSIDELCSTSWAVCVWIYPMMDELYLSELDIMRIETAPNSSRIGLSIRSSGLMIRYSEKRVEIQCDMLDPKWRMLTVVRRLCVRGDVHEPIYTLQLYIDSSLVWSEIDIKGIMFVHSIYLCMNDTPNIRNRVSDNFENFRGLLGCTMFLQSGISDGEVKSLYNHGPEFLNDHLAGGTAFSNMTFSSYLMSVVQTNAAILYPRKVLVNSTRFKPVTGYAKVCRHTSPKNATRSLDDLRAREGHVFRTTVNFKFCIDKPYSGVTFELYNAFTYKVSSLSVAIRAIYGARILLLYMDNLDRPKIVKKADKNTDSNSNTIDVFEYESLEPRILRACKQRRICLLAKIITNILEDPISCRSFFDSTGLNVIQFILSTRGGDYLCSSLLHIMSHFVELSKKFGDGSRYHTLVETNILFSHFIWSQIRDDHLEGYFTLLRLYISAEIGSNNRVLSSRCKDYAVYVTRYLFKVIFYCKSYVENALPCIGDAWKDIKLLITIPVTKDQELLKYLTEMLHEIFARGSGHAFRTAGKLFPYILIPEKNEPETGERIGYFLRRLIFKAPLEVTAGIIESILEHCGIYILFEICSACPNLIPLALEIIHLMHSLDMSASTTFLMAKELYVDCTNGETLRKEKKEWITHYTLLYPVKTLSLDEYLIYSLMQLAFGVALIDAQTGSILSRKNSPIARLTPSKPYINMIFYVLRMNNNPKMLLRALHSLFGSNLGIMEGYDGVNLLHLQHMCCFLHGYDELSGFDIGYPQITLGDVAESWIAAYLAELMWDTDIFCGQFQSIICYLHCLYKPHTALDRLLCILRALISKLKTNYPVHTMFNNMLYLISTLSLFCESNYLNYICSRFNKPSDGYSGLMSAVFAGPDTNWSLMFNDGYTMYQSDKYINGLKEIVISKSPGMYNYPKSSAPSEHSPSIGAEIINRINSTYSNLYKNPKSNCADIEVWFEVTSTYLYILRKLAILCGTDFMCILDDSLNLIIDCVRSFDYEKSHVIKIYKCVIGIVEEFITASTNLSEGSEKELNSPTFRATYLYSKILSLFENGSICYKDMSCDVRPEVLKIALSGGLYDIQSFITSKPWRKYIKRHIYPELSSTLHCAKNFCDSANSALQYQFASRAQEIYNEFLSISYYPRYHKKSIDDELETISKNRRKILIMEINADIEKYNDLSIKKIMLNKRIICENGLLTNNVANWMVDSRSFRPGVRKRLVPNWNIVRDDSDLQNLDGFEYMKVSSEMAHEKKAHEQRGLISVTTRIKLGLLITSMNAFNTTNIDGLSMSNIFNNILADGTDFVERLVANVKIQSPCSTIINYLPANDYNQQNLYSAPHGRELIISMRCEYIFALYLVKGILYLTDEELVFIQDFCTGVTGTSDNPNYMSMLKLPFSGENYSRKKTWRLDDIEQCLSRRYLLRQSALEFFFKDKKSCFLNFPKSTDSAGAPSRMTLLNAILKLRPEMSNNILLFGNQTFSTFLELSTRDWVRRRISNFEYLMRLNTLSGRTYNDFTQYPIFPWVLSDYESEKVDLSNEKVYRDLSKPIGALDEDKLRNYLSRFENLEQGGEGSKPFMYGTHYSSAAVVVFYLIRIEPFATIHRSLQGGRFDSADRLFYSIENCWESVQTNTYDVKELIPEFFYMPDFLHNINNYNFGKNISGEVVNDVILPKWASSPHDFIRINREALESEYVSANLHHWIDLIWGYKQTGKEAMKAHNLFHYLTYEGSIDIDSIKDGYEKNSTILQITHFGQTPSKLFTGPHRPRLCNTMPPEISPDLDDLTYILDISKRKYVNGISLLHPIAINNLSNSPMVKGRSYVSSPSLVVSIIGKTMSLMNISDTNNTPTYEHALCVINHKYDIEIMCIEKPHFNKPTVVFPFSTRLKFGFSSGDVNEDGVKFAISDSGKFIVVFRIWDNSFIIVDMRTQDIKCSNPVKHHSDIVGCACFCESEDIIYTGSEDSTIYSWRISSILGEVIINPVNEYVGHSGGIIKLCCNAEHDMLVSSSESLDIIVHSCLDARYMYSLKPRKFASYNSCKVSSINITRDALLAIHVIYKGEKQEQRNEGSSEVDNARGTLSKVDEVSLYNINGLHITTRCFKGLSGIKHTCYAKYTDRIIVLLKYQVVILSPKRYKNTVFALSLHHVELTLYSQSRHLEIY